MKNSSLGLRCFFLGALVLVLAAGCSTLTLNRNANTRAGQNPAAAGGEKSPVYYDFDDIAIPAGFKLSKDDSLVYQSGGLKSGLLAFDGRIEPISAANFMVATMAADNWRMKSSFKYGRTLMLFEKPGKSAIISIAESITNTRLEVWVAPTPEATGTPAAAGGK
ncbi:MAG: hypothetical protein V2A77_07385 [Pseudomonadota bacterium]